MMRMMMIIITIVIIIIIISLLIIDYYDDDYYIIILSLLISGWLMRGCRDLFLGILFPDHPTTGSEAMYDWGSMGTWWKISYPAW